MATNPTASDITAILDDYTGSTTAFDSLITDAANYFDALYNGLTFTDAFRTTIVKWLAAHLVVSTLHKEVNNVAISAGSQSSVYFSVLSREGLHTSRYGEMAMTLDIFNLLGKKVVSINSITQL